MSKGGEHNSFLHSQQENSSPYDMMSREDVDALMRQRAETMTWPQRRAWMKRVNATAKVILIGGAGWVIHQAREHALRTVAVGTIGVTAAGVAHMSPAVEVSPGPPPVVTMPHAPGPPAPAPPRPTATVTMAPPAATVTAEPRIQAASPSAAPVQTEATGQPAPEPTHEPTHQVPTTPEPTPEPTWVTDPPVATSEPTLPPPPRPTATASPTSQPPGSGRECVELPDRTGVDGEVCEPPAEVDADDRWLQCMDEELLVDIMRCVRNPDVWFS